MLLQSLSSTPPSTSPLLQPSRLPPPLTPPPQPLRPTSQSTSDEQISMVGAAAYPVMNVSHRLMPINVALTKSYPTFEPRTLIYLLTSLFSSCLMNRKLLQALEKLERVKLGGNQSLNSVGSISIMTFTRQQKSMVYGMLFLYLLYSHLEGGI